MNRKNKISTGNFLRSLILLVMMGWMESAWAQDAATNIATGNKGSVYFDYNGIRVNGEPEKDKAYHITYNAGEHASGTSPEATWVEEGDLFKIPRNTTLYYEGNTLALWKDSKGGEYEIGKRYKAQAINLRMLPVFEPNLLNLFQLNKEATATWNFTKDDDAPTINYQKTAGILVTQLEIKADETEETYRMDVKIDLDATATKSKFDN